MDTYPSRNTLRRISLADLEPDIENVFVIAVIIAKQRPRTFNANQIKGTNEIETQKSVWNFTIRDSPRDYINVTYWDRVDAVAAVGNKYHTGDVVEISYLKVVLRRINDYGEQFRPMVTSPYSMILTPQSQIRIHPGNCQTYINLLHLPTKPISQYVLLRDIHQQGASMKDRHVDILVAVRSVGIPRNVTTKKGETSQCREVIVFDQSSPGLKFTLWEPDIIIRAGQWKPRNTILFVADVKVDWSNFLRSFCVTLNTKSIVTENPIGPGIESFIEYAKNAPLQASAIVDELVTSIPDPKSIQNVMSIKQIQNRVNRYITEKCEVDQQFSALVYATITHLDLDGLSPTTRAKCVACKNWIKPQSICEYPDCPVNSGTQAGIVDIKFDLRVNLTDHTGTLVGTRLSGNTAEMVLNTSIEQFLAMTDQEKCMLKWRYLMEQCAVRLMVLIINRRNPVISIISCEVANPIEAAQKMPLL